MAVCPAASHHERARWGQGWVAVWVGGPTRHPLPTTALALWTWSSARRAHSCAHSSSPAACRPIGQCAPQAWGCPLGPRTVHGGALGLTSVAHTYVSEE